MDERNRIRAKARPRAIATGSVKRMSHRAGRNGIERACEPRSKLEFELTTGLGQREPISHARKRTPVDHGLRIHAASRPVAVTAADIEAARLRHNAYGRKRPRETTDRQKRIAALRGRKRKC